MDWLAQAIRNTWSSQVKTPMDIRGWRAIEEGQALLRELGMRKKYMMPGSLDLIRTVFTRDLKNLIQQGP